MSPWWNAHDGNLFGGIGGAVLGVLGGTLGFIAGIFAPRGRGRSAILTAFALFVFFGAVSLVAGIVALFVHQPRHVWYPLVLLGGIIVIVVPVQLPNLLSRYRQAELRKLAAEELRRA